LNRHKKTDVKLSAWLFCDECHVISDGCGLSLVIETSRGILKTVAIPYFAGAGHTQKLAEIIAEGINSIPDTKALLINVESLKSIWVIPPPPVKKINIQWLWCAHFTCKGIENTLHL